MSFGFGLHVMAALAFNSGQRLRSVDLADSVGANPVTIRRVLGQLAAANLVENEPGPNGGSMLARPAERISILDIHQAVGEPELMEGHTKDPQEFCPVSRCMPDIFSHVNSVVLAAASPTLGALTLQDLVDSQIRA